MSDRTHHSEWLSLIDVSGPFLAEPVLKEAFPQGLGGLDSAKKTMLRQAYGEWREAQDLDDPLLLKIHGAWIDLVLKQGLELDEQGNADVLKPRVALPDTLACVLPEYGVTLRPDYAVVDAEDKPLMLIATYAPDISLTDASKGDTWAGSPAERMIELCRAMQVRLGLVTNGEHWMFVDAPVNAATTMATWYAQLWGQEPLTLQAFVNLLGVRRFFVDRSEQLPALLDKSLEHQNEVTDALGEQVRRAVEVLIQALERADVDRKRELLEGIEPAELYDAGLTVMMRIVFLLSAEERGLLLMGDPRYEANYAISTLRLQLRANSDEILERRQDAWSRLLSVFRAVYGGIDHNSMRLPALGGSLFDPDRYPFLEGRAKGSTWRTDPAKPLPIDNRTVMLLLEAVQLFQGRTLSYLALDVEQIGYVYEGLLERTAVRAPDVTLDLAATKNADNPWVSLSELDGAAAQGGKAVEELLKERTGSAVTRVRNDLAKQVDDASTERLLAACHGDRDLRDRMKPYFHLLRTDPWGYPLVYPKGTFMVRTGSDRRETGTHYTPKPLTEAIVTATLEPLVYVGPSEGKPRGEWKLKSPSELLDLKVCDPAMGSGAFLVQVCRWLSERLVEAWQQAEGHGKAVTSDGEVLDTLGAREPLRNDPAEKSLVARRLIAERCLYGVDMNPLAVELAKLSIWLVTLAKERPFGFLDHNLRCGDSLLGVTTLDQIADLEMKSEGSVAKKLFASKMDPAISRAVEHRLMVRRQTARDIRDVEAMASLEHEARKDIHPVSIIADAFLGEVMVSDAHPDLTSISIEAGEALAGNAHAIHKLSERAANNINIDKPGRKRRPFHWPLEFPEAFSNGGAGFDAFVGNPPFMGDRLISGSNGVRYHQYLTRYCAADSDASVDLVVYFFLRAFKLLSPSGTLGFLGRRSIAEGKNREAGLQKLLSQGAAIYHAKTSIPWPGKASVVVHQIHISKRTWSGPYLLNDSEVAMISSYLEPFQMGEIRKIPENLGRIFQGTILLGEGFKITEETAKALLSNNSSPYAEILYPFIGGNELNKSPSYQPACWAISFWDWPKEKAAGFASAFKIIEQQVFPERIKKSKEKSYKNIMAMWWLHWRARPELYHAVGRGELFDSHPDGWSRASQRTPSRIIAISTGVTKFPAFTFVSNNMIYSNKICVLADQRFATFAVLSSDIHGVWAWSQKTSMGGDLHSLVYAHGNIFETFPFPNGILSAGDDGLEEHGKAFFSARQKFMEEKSQGLTKFYNEFHNPRRTDERMWEIRRLHGELNRLSALRYGWDDIDVSCDFQQVGYLPIGSNIRFTVSEAARLELIGRLSRENQVRTASQLPIDTASASEPEEDEPLEEGLFAPGEGRRGASGG